jgi:hypothetical protein
MEDADLSAGSRKLSRVALAMESVAIEYDLIISIMS